MNGILTLVVASLIAVASGRTGGSRGEPLVPAGPGDIAWTAAYSGSPSGPDSAKAIAVDDSGNVVVVGSSEGQGTGMDIATVKYAPDGTQLWATRFNDTLASDDEAADVVVDRLGNVIVAGYGGTSPSDQDYTTIKYNAAGVQQWVARYNSPDNNGDFASAIAVDDSGNVFVTGWCVNIFGINADYATVKYSPDGVRLWVARYNGTGDDNDYASDIAVDSSGNAYVTGNSRTPDNAEDFVTVKYNAAGVQQWVARYNGNQNLADKGVVIALDRLDNAVVSGWTQIQAGPPSISLYVTIKYDHDGNELWRSFYGGPAVGASYPTAMAIDGSGSVYVTGASAGIGTGLDYATVKYDEEGNERWTSRFGLHDSGDDVPNDIAVDRDSRVYVTGYTTTAPGLRDYATVRYDSLGVRGWTAIYDGPAADDDAAVGIGLDSSENVYVTGSSFFSGTGRDFLTIKYEADGSGILENGRPPKPAAPSLTVTPNPARGYATVAYSSRRPGHSQLSFYDVNGAARATVELGELPAGSHRAQIDLARLPKGVYILKLLSGTETATSKLVIN
jgi:uncharacterized delta-60 repeat protein